MRNENTLYHCTTYDNLKNIFKEGIKPHDPSVRKPTVKGLPKGVYLCEFPIDWMEWATDEFTKRGALLKIDITNLELYGDLDKRIDIKRPITSKAHRGIYSKKVIPPENIVGVEIETEVGSGKFVTVDIISLKKELEV